MTLWRVGPKRLSPSLIVWQVRHALLNVSCPDSLSTPLRADSWGTAENPRSIRNVMQTTPEIAVRGIRPPLPRRIERVVVAIRSSVRSRQKQLTVTFESVDSRHMGDL